MVRERPPLGIALLEEGVAALSGLIGHVGESGGLTGEDLLADQAVVSLAPLRSTAGIQNKVLEAAALGLPQVVAPAALAGMRDGFPAVVADTPDDFLDRARTLVEDVSGRQQLAEDAWSYTHHHYTADAWLPVLWDLIHPTDERAPAWVTQPAVES